MIKAAELNELKPGKIKRITSADQALLLCNVGGEYYAVADLCPHEDFPLSYGCLKGNDIECSLHGARFDVRSGMPSHEPADCPLQTFLVVIQEDGVFIDDASGVD